MSQRHIIKKVLLSKYLTGTGTLKIVIFKLYIEFLLKKTVVCTVLVNLQICSFFLT
jgi:hypothetical protein